ncbi:hypothetical protein GPJ56_009577 [Histomonas meleagridis]|uniref:uncharacterized protein n=1 Tax=Histomonas meleagridis TaxID=135588 RepID=UPI00355A87BE|nr:hypothetical protein GPJ56_009577 [Histomonas meleagridis]KAH0799656.1 hypothetical protein GO595_007570 [Histomonas meleagridis]
MPQSPRPSSRQKKTGITILANQNPIKKPTISDLRNEKQIPRSPRTFQNDKPTSARQQTPTFGSSEQFKKPTISDLNNIKFDFNVNKKEEPGYKPYTIEEYREIQQMEDFSSRGGLGPSLDEEWERKKEMRTRLMQFGQRIKQDNKANVVKRAKPRKPPPKQQSKTDKMKEYANSIPKPKIHSRAGASRPKSKPKADPVVATYDIDAELQRHHHFSERINSFRKSLAKYLD